MYERGGRYDKLELVPLEKPEANDSLDFAEGFHFFLKNMNLSHPNIPKGGVKKAFIRKNHKFWIPRHRFFELMSRLAAYMPLYYFGEKFVGEFQYLLSERPSNLPNCVIPDPLTTSVYLDNENLAMYSRRLRREDGATLIRFRVRYFLFSKKSLTFFQGLWRRPPVPSWCGLCRAQNPSRGNLWRRIQEGKV